MSSQRNPSLRCRRRTGQQGRGCSRPWVQSSAAPWRGSLPSRFYTTPEQMAPSPMTAAGSRMERQGAALKPASLVLRAGIDGALLVPDLAYPRAFTLRVGRTDQSYVDLDDPLRLEFDYVQ